MEGKLIKVENGYVLMVNNIMYATDNDKLSLKNCQAIENGYDLDELVNRAFDNMGYHSTVTPYEEKQFKLGYRVAFREVLEILGDKKFGEEDMRRALSAGLSIGYGRQFEIENKQIEIDSYIKSLQQTEWEVEIEMEDVFIKNSDQYIDEVGVGNYSTHTKKPKLDADGCLILKRK
jgi:hypothetical protein